MDEHLLTVAEIQSLNNKGAFPILSRIQAGAAALNAGTSYNIKKTDYADVYATSDVHADLKKLHYLLSQAGLVSGQEFVEVSSIMNGIASGGIEWIKPKTLFVIVGDIVDGAREDSVIEDSIGNIEALLHAYLYNLRIKARSVGSEIRFTLGNHDWHSVILEKEDSSGLYSSYVHQKAKDFFGTYNKRRSWLLPFYEACPYIFISVDNEVAFVHGGMHSKTYNGKFIANNKNELMRLQSAIDGSGNFNPVLLNVNDSKYLGCDEPSRCKSEGWRTGSPLWSRFYAEGSAADVCAQISKPENTYRFTVVGHCQTEPGNFPHHDEIMARPEYKSCNCGGLVLIGCPNVVTGPRLAFVDIGMSSCFRDGNWDSESERRAEFLHLKHNSDKAVTERYYNIIIREKIRPDIEPILVWEAPSISGGRRRTKRMRIKRRRTEKRRPKARKF